MMLSATFYNFFSPLLTSAFVILENIIHYTFKDVRPSCLENHLLLTLISNVDNIDKIDR